MVSILNKMRGGIITLICLYAIVTFQLAFSSPADRETTPSVQTPANEGQTTPATQTTPDEGQTTSATESPAGDVQTTPATESPGDGQPPSATESSADDVQTTPATESPGDGQATSATQTRRGRKKGRKTPKPPKAPDYGETTYTCTRPRATDAVVIREEAGNEDTHTSADAEPAPRVCLTAIPTIQCYADMPSYVNKLFIMVKCIRPLFASSTIFRSICCTAKEKDQGQQVMADLLDHYLALKAKLESCQCRLRPYRKINELFTKYAQIKRRLEGSNLEPHVRQHVESWKQVIEAQFEPLASHMNETVMDALHVECQQMLQEIDTYIYEYPNVAHRKAATNNESAVENTTSGQAPSSTQNGGGAESAVENTTSGQAPSSTQNGGGAESANR